MQNDLKLQKRTLKLEIYVILRNAHTWFQQGV